jgi:hypothetical protein
MCKNTSKTTSLFAGLTALFAMASAQAAVCPGDVTLVYTRTNDDTGHTYEVWRKDGIKWEDAEACALRPLEGVPGAIVGHLATVTSSGENTWLVDDLLQVALSKVPPKLAQSQVWVGGFRDISAGPGAWRWVNNEGPFSSVNGGTVFTNWAENTEGEQIEPNNVGGSENHVTLGRFETLYGWNDEGSAVNTIGGFIVEYDTPREIGDCSGLESPTQACTTIEGQTLTFPANSFGANDTVTFSAFEFNDPRIDPLTGKCSGSPNQNRGPLILFDDVAAFGSNASLTIPEYLCGSPRFLVVKVEAEDLDIFKGAVEIEHDTAVVLPDNLYECSDPILGNLTPGPLYSEDPQEQDVIVWQSTDPSRMLEGPAGLSPPSVGVGPSTGIYAGTATEATNGCGSTTGKSRTASYFVVGMHIDFNRDYPLDEVALYQDFFALTQYKLQLLLQSVQNARAALVIRNPEGRAMESQVRNAINAMNAGDPAAALTSINQFLKKVNDSTYQITGVPADQVEYNYNGDHLMRGENIKFMLRVKVIPYKP